jgi:hypothetical protein
MKIGRASAGESRACPHCQATILKSATACPICRHMLRANTLSFEAQAGLTACPLSIEGTIEHPGAGSPLEYQVLMEIRDDAGKVVSRQIVGVGALLPSEKRVFSLRVEMSDAGSAVH